MIEKSAVYRICFAGVAEQSWSSLFDDVTVTRVGEEGSVITARVSDQAALRGIVERIWDLNLVLLSVSCLEPAGEGPDPGAT